MNECSMWDCMLLSALLSACLAYECFYYVFMSSCLSDCLAVCWSSAWSILSFCLHVWLSCAACASNWLSDCLSVLSVCVNDSFSTCIISLCFSVCLPISSYVYLFTSIQYLLQITFKQYIH